MARTAGGKGKGAEAKKADEIIQEDDVKQLDLTDTEQDATPVKSEKDKPKKEKKEKKNKKSEDDDSSKEEEKPKEEKPKKKPGKKPKTSDNEAETEEEKPKEEKPKEKKPRKPRTKKVDDSDEEMPKEKNTRKRRAKKDDSEKRAPTLYNLFVKEVMPELKAENLKKPEDERLTQRELMTMAAGKWQEHKKSIAAN